MTRFLVIICIAASTAAMQSCTDTVKREGGCSSIELGAPFSASIGDTWCLESADLRIRFGDILEDSRCNVEDINCFWAGRFVSLVTLSLADMAVQDTFYAVNNWSDTLQYAGYEIMLTRVIPIERDSIAPVDTASYRLEMLIE